MKGFRRILALSFAIVAVLALAACCLGCGGGGGAKQFQGFDARSVDDLGNMAEAAMTEAKELDSKTADKEQKSKADDLFEEGNTQYRSTNYSQATKKYQEALEYNAVHHGANVNLTLSLLQEDKAEEALAQALKCVALFPKDAGCLLNAQAAGTACKFYSDDLDNWLDIIVSERGSTSVSAVLTPSSKSKGSSSGNNMIWDDAYTYNAIWNRIETELYQGKKTSQNVPETASADAYQSMQDTLADLDSDDTDVAALQAYLEGVAQQLKLNE